MTWSAEITNSPDIDCVEGGFNLYLELLEDGHFRARVFRAQSTGELFLEFYGGSAATVPVEWLLGILERFKVDVAGRGGIKGGH